MKNVQKNKNMTDGSKEIKEAKVFGKESEKEPVFKRVCLSPSKKRWEK